MIFVTLWGAGFGVFFTVHFVFCLLGMRKGGWFWFHIFAVLVCENERTRKLHLRDTDTK